MKRTPLAQANKPKNGRGVALQAASFNDPKVPESAPRRSRINVRRVTDCQIINSLARGLKVLSAFGPADSVLSNKDLAVRTGIPKPTISRLTSTLVRLSFLVHDTEQGGYRVGPATLTLGVSASAKADLPHIAQPFMRAFAEEHGVGVSLGVRDGLEMRALIYTATDEYSDNAEQSVHKMLAARQPLEASGLGYALLAALSVSERQSLYREMEVQVGASWHNVHRRIQFAIEDIERSGFCTSIREWKGLINCAATPLSMTATGVPVSLSCSAPASFLTESRIRNSIGPALVRLKDAIWQASGHT
jgi:DNA-binding IclR family transcriptional regulator